MSIIKTNWLVLYKEVVAWCCEDHMEHPTTLCGKVQSFLMPPHLVHIITTELKVVSFSHCEAHAEGITVTRPIIFFIAPETNYLSKIYMNRLVNRNNLVHRFS